MSTSGLSAAGGAIYNGRTQTVGDGTWDSTRNDFLLPNIQGLNYETMRYNGMGNRFRDLAEYHSIIKAHAIIAAITFLGIVPLAIFMARFYYRDPRFALKTHISLHVLTVILSTVILVLGYFAVGPSRSLTNPHHGIGVVIYVLVLIQFLWGALVHRLERRKIRYFLPIKLMLHQWLGRAIALLALAQIPIGLTLYGSPIYLFILYAVLMTIFILIWFILTYETQRRIGLAASYDEQSSYVSGTQTDFSRPPDQRSRFGVLTGALAGGVGIEALRRRLSNRSRGNAGRSDVAYSQGPYNAPAAAQQYQSRLGGGTETYTEKYSDDGRNHTWRDRLLGGAAGLGAAATARHYWNRAMGREDERYDDRYQQTAHGARITDSTARLDQMEEGRPLVPPGAQGNIAMGAMGTGQQQTLHDPNWTRVEQMEAAQAAAMAQASGGAQYPPVQYPSVQNQPLQSQYQPYPQGRRLGDSTLSDESRRRRDDEAYGRRGFLERFATAGGVGEYLKRRRSQKEQRRVDEQRQRERENERLYGRPSGGQPTPGLVVGDDVPRPNTGIPTSHVSFREPLTDQQYQTTVHDFATSGPTIVPVQVPVPGASQSQGYPGSYNEPLLPQNVNPPPAPPNHQNLQRQQQPIYNNPPNQPYVNQRPTASPFASRTNLPSTSSPLRNPPIQSQIPQAQGQLPIPPPPTMLNPPPPTISPSRATPPSSYPYVTTGPSFNNSNNPNLHRPSAASPPVAVKVRVHDDHVTLRRLNEEEAAAEREMRRRAREQQQQQQQAGQLQPPGGARFGGPSVSDLSNTNAGTGAGPGGYYRRQGQQPQQPPQQQQQQAAPYPRQSLYNGASSGPSNIPQGVTVTAPGSYYQQETQPHPQRIGLSPPSVPVPGVGTGLGSSPGGAYDTATGTDVSSYDQNRRRRRAERARAEQARLAARMGGFGSEGVSGLGPLPGEEGGGPGGAVGGGGRRVGFI